VIRKINSGIKINELLVLTFTRAAAEEMKKRIQERLIDNPKQLDLLPTAYITTFDSFAASILKKYHFLLNLNNNYQIDENSILLLEKKRIIDQIFDEYYQRKDAKFLKLIKDFCLKDDEFLKQNILKINNKIILKYDYQEYLNNYEKLIFNDKKINLDKELYLDLIKDKIKFIDSLLSKASLELEMDRYHYFFDCLNPLLNSKTYEEFKKYSDVSFNKSVKDSEQFKLIKQQIKKVVDEVKDLCVYESEEDLKNKVYLTKDYVLCVVEILKEFNLRLDSIKKENQIYEFIDITRFSIKLVKEYPEVREEIKNKFQEILIDEYQDTNDLQEEFINEISKNNVYLVGDIKQSIYRFRNANPNLFQEKFELYKNNQGGLKIDLNRNFRSRLEVIEDINLLFDYLMDYSLTKVNYREEHRLIYGNNKYSNELSNESNNHLELYNYSLQPGQSKSEVESYLIGKDILEKINNKYLVADKDIMRPCQYSDFTILIDRKSHFDTFQKMFSYLGIPLKIKGEEKVINSNHILVINSILKLIKSCYEEKCDLEFERNFYSVGRSFLFSLTDEELLTIKNNKSYQKTEIYQKIKEIAIDLKSLSLKLLLEKIIDKFDIYMKLITIGNIKDICLRIDYLLKICDLLSNLNYQIEDLIEYFDLFFASEDLTMPSLEDETEAVLLTSIHQSKGLEFPICYYPLLDSKFNKKETTDKFVFSKQFGIITHYQDEYLKATFYRYLFKYQDTLEDIQEKLRLFYVALTRSKEKMIMVGDFNKESNNELKDVVDFYDRFNYKSYRDVIISLKDIIQDKIKDIDLPMVNKDYLSFKQFNYDNLKSNQVEPLNIEELKINYEVIKQKQASKKINRLLTEIELNNLDYGNKLHYYLEMIDFKEPNFSLIEEDLIPKIKAFLNCDLLNNINDSKVYKEYEFIYNSNQIEKRGIIDLIIEESDCLKVIDYKMKNIDDEAYEEQLKTYRDYLKTITDKKIELYLYSIMEEKYKSIY
ncbi:MAG: UvrD-helicase domain-containing protein, partial [Bacilli bacterium]